MGKNNNAVIDFKGYRIENIDFKTYSSEDEFSEVELENGQISVWIGFSDDHKEALLKITTIVLDASQLRSIVLELSGQFEINCSVEESQEFLKYNGVAIMFPYVRSIISMISSLDNENAIVLPTINVSNLID